MSAGWRLFAAFAALHLVFAVWPGIDLWVSRLFYVAGQGFALDDSGFWQGVRMTLWRIALLPPFLAVAGLIVAFGLGRRARVPARLWGFALALYLLGPGLIVNRILKAHWGRARPATVTDFGGSLDFSPPFQMVDQCSRNCSFVSGEAAAAAAFFLTVLIVVMPGLSVQARRLSLIWVGGAAAFMSLLRVAMGRHFLSDVIFAWLIVALVALGLARYFRLWPGNRQAPALRRGDVAADLRLWRSAVLRPALARLTRRG